MPQIWLSDEELGAMLDCPAPAARARSIAWGWARRRSHDGLSRTKLPAGVFDQFLLDYAARLMARPAAERSTTPWRTALAGIDAPAWGGDVACDRAA